MIPLFLGNLKFTEIAIIAVVVLLLFGANKIPSIMRNIGKGIHAMKQGLYDAKQEIDKDVDKGDKPADAAPEADGDDKK